MIGLSRDVRVWLATGHTDMRKGFGLALLVQETLKRNPHDGNLFVFRGRRGDLLKIIWHDGQGACLFTKRLERGRFLWPSMADGVVTISVRNCPICSPGLTGECPRKHGVPRRPDKLRRIDSGCFSGRFSAANMVQSGREKPLRSLPSDLAGAHAMILAQRELLAQEQAEKIVAQSEAKVIRLEIERLKFLLAKARREKFGQSSERGKLLIEQLELAIEDLEETQGAEGPKPR